MRQYALLLAPLTAVLWSWGPQTLHHWQLTRRRSQLHHWPLYRRRSQLHHWPLYRRRSQLHHWPLYRRRSQLHHWQLTRRTRGSREIPILPAFVWPGPQVWPVICVWRCSCCVPGSVISSLLQEVEGLVQEEGSTLEGLPVRQQGGGALTISDL